MCLREGLHPHVPAANHNYDGYRAKAHEPGFTTAYKILDKKVAGEGHDRAKSGVDRRGR